MITDDVPLDELAGSWDEIREEYYDLRNDGYDRTVLDCAARLAEDPGGESACVWTIGLLMMAPYVAGAPGDGVVSAARSALEAADGALRDRPCGHETHPYQEHEPEFDEDLGRQLCGLYDPDAAWHENHPREQWLCPRNVAGLARIALDIIEPGSASDVPPRLPVGTQDTIASLSALLHGYPEPGTDIESEIGIHAEELRSAEPANRPGRLLVVMAVAWYAASDFVRNPAVLDELISALETTLPHYADARCTHDRHPAPPRSGPNAAALGIKLSSPAGRALYERDRTRTDPLDQLLCPVALSEITNDAMRALVGRREELH
ncbi:hypothetical protein DMH26_04270 [Streptomyces sp. WAC 05379]|uniref:hypothetical protein n=1 Tax=Streptomyces sp. WAC 05379 TaxID=2203207 RepID=UPI000F747BEB|nr:hypothetical protein [Streptomyces sp. WAC 05379]RSO07752.1 hypothetical protein DMH26_04270 [Streptomyces sp. WAC 05379]